jgi:putative nucleotidyltransferase with HDIG domain
MAKTLVPKKRILLVEDDDFFRPTLEESIQAAGYEVRGVPGGAEAQSILGLETFDAVVSDINMPGVNGVQLLNWIKRHRPLPVILMTGFADLAETLDAHESGAAGFLTKPFRKEELIAAIAACFPGSAAPAAEPEDLDGQYCKLSLDDFVSGSNISYDIYARLSANKYIRIAYNGQDISVERIKSYKQKGIHHLYMNKEDFRRYVNFNAKLVGAVAKSSKISKAKKLNFLKHTAEIVSASIFGDTPDREVVEDARSIVESSIQLLTDDDDAFAVLDVLNSHADFLYAHSVAVSFYSVLLARQLKWKSQATFVKLSEGALFHDIGKKEIPKEILTKTRTSLSVEEAMLLESHTTRGAQILSELPGLPSDAVQIALEHHENCVGFGFPRRLRHNKIHPLAKLVSVANEFCKLTLKSPNREPVAPLQAINQMMTLNSEYYDPETSVALMNLFHYPVPPLFVEDVKKRQRAT